MTPKKSESASKSTAVKKVAAEPARASRARTLGGKPAQSRGTANYEPASEEAQRFGRALAAARQMAGYSQKAVGDELGRSQAAVATWEHGVYVPLPQDIFRMEQMFGVPAGSLSQHLGFLPVSGSGRSTPSEVIGAITKDAKLSDRDKQVVIDLYRSMSRN